MPTTGPSALPAGPSRPELRAALASLVLSILLTGIKFFAYLITRSDAVFSDALENIVNIFTSGFALYSISLAHRPADQEHPYGHGKIEFLSAGLEGSMVLLASVLIVGKVALSYLRHSSPDITRLDLGLILMAGALFLNGGLGLFLWQIGRRLRSLTLEADGAHLLTDAIDSAVVLFALTLVHFTGWKWVDSAAALLVAVYIAILGLNLIKRSAAGLMDEQDAGDQQMLRGILDSHVGPTGKEPRICSYHKLRHRHSGRYHWVDFHIMVPSWWDIDKAHKVASAIEYEIELALKAANATAHVEPCADAQCAHCQASQTAPAH